MRTAQRLLLLTFTVACLTSLNLSEAKKPPKPPGGVGGGGGDTPSFSPLELHVPDGISTSEGPIPRDINDLRHVVGYVQDGQGIANALYWTVNANGVSAYDLGSQSMANAINERDEIVGTGNNAVNAHDVPILWTDPDTDPVELPLPAGHPRGRANAINDDGFIVGSAGYQFTTTDQNGDLVTYWSSHAAAWRFLWIDGTLKVSSPLLLGGLELNQADWAEGVSGAEETVEGVHEAKIVGTAYNSSDTQAVMWEVVSSVDEQGEIQLELVTGPNQLGSLPGISGGHGDAINRNGDVAGTPGYRKLYGQPLEELLPPSSINEPGLSYIDDINDLAEVVGVHYYGYGYSTPVLWLTDGSAFDLNKNLGGTLWARFHAAEAINNGQCIVGYGYLWTSKRKKERVDAAFVLIPN